MEIEVRKIFVAYLKARSIEEQESFSSPYYQYFRELRRGLSEILEGIDVTIRSDPETSKIIKEIEEISK